MLRSRRSNSSHRVLIVDDGEGLWGAQRYMMRLAPFLRDRGYVLGLLSPAGSDMAAAWTREGLGVTFALEPADLNLSARDERGKLALAKVLGAFVRLVRRGCAIAKVARRFEADVVVANSYWSHFDATFAGRLSGRGVVIYAHEECPSGLPAVALRFAVRLASTTIAVSHDVARSIGSRRKVTVVANGVDVVRFSPGPVDQSLRRELATSPNEPLVVVLCRLDRPKQVDHVVKAVAGLEGSLGRTQLAIIGDSTTDRDYAEEVRELGQELLGERVRFFAPRDDVSEVLRCADLYVLAGRQEGMPLGILEAQATGCPVVAYPAAGVRNSVIANVSGLLAAPNDWKSLRDQIAIVLADQKLGEELASHALEMVRAHFNLTTQAAAVADIFDGL